MFDFRKPSFFKGMQLPFKKTRTPVETPLSQPLKGTSNNGREPRKSPGLNVRWADSYHHDPNIVIIMCNYFGGTQGGNMQLESVKNDVSLLLRHLKYSHKNETRRWFFLMDFDLEYVDSSGLNNTIPTIPATRHNIETLTLGIMRDLKGHDNCLFYFTGHLELDLVPRHHVDTPNDPTPSGTAIGLSQAFSSTIRDALDPALVDPSFGQHILLPKNDKIYGHEFRRWLSKAKFASTVIVVTLDACHSGEFLGLEYSYSDEIWTQTLATADDKMTSLVIEIASTTKPQLSFNECYSEDPVTPPATHGNLTWHLVQYLKDKPEIRISELVSYLQTKCDTLWTDDKGHEWRQLPQISSSRIVNGSITLF